MCPGQLCARLSYVRESGRLGVDALDLTQTHSLPLEAMRDTPIFDALRELREEGKIAAIIPELNMGQMRREVVRVNGGRTRVIGLSKVDGTMIKPEEILRRIREVK